MMFSKRLVGKAISKNKNRINVKSNAIKAHLRPKSVSKFCLYIVQRIIFKIQTKEKAP